VATTLGLIKPATLVYDFSMIFYKFQIWRLVTSFCFFGAFGIPFLIQMLILTRYFTTLEQGYFQGARGTAELVFFCVFNGICMLVLDYMFLGSRIFGMALVMSALYLWSRKEPYNDVMLYGFKLTAWHFPFVILVLAFLGLGDPVQTLLGIVVGHLYHFLMDIVPYVYNVTVLKTPDFLYRYFETGSVRPPRSAMSGPGYSLS
jgi:Derlin-2/3